MARFCPLLHLRLRTLPRLIRSFPGSLRPNCQVRHFCDRRVLRNEGGQRHDAAVLGLIGRTAKELPIAILIVRDEQDRVRSIQDSCGREDRTVFALVEGPRPVSGKDRLAALERSGKIGMPRIPALPIGPYALQDREVITLVEPPCITKVFPIEVRLDLPKDAQVPFENLVTLTPSLRT